jgi:hypothetical protein
LGVFFGVGEPGRLVGMDAAMRSPLHPSSAAQRDTNHTGQAGSDRALAEHWLGSSHRLVDLLRRSDTAREQLVWVTAAVVAGPVFLTEGLRFGLALAIAALVVELGLACRLAALRSHRRELCLELIVKGHERLPLACVDRELRRLRDLRTRQRLAGSIDEILKIVALPRPPHPASRPLFRIRVVRAVASELDELASSLRSVEPGVRGVAAVELLLRSSSTSLYGIEVEPLRQELARARYLLRDGR